VILYRCFAWNVRAGHTEADGPLWFARAYQGDGRHDNPDLFGCMYLADRAVSSVVEQLARFRGQRLSAPLLRRRGLPLALAQLELAESAELIDLDAPTVLRRERLRPSLVATRDRTITQPQARALHDRHAAAAGIRWWSTYEARWMNVTLFERAAPQLSVRDVQELTIDAAAVQEAAQLFALQVR